MLDSVCVCVSDVWYVDGDGCAVVPVYFRCVACLSVSFLIFYSQNSRSVIGDRRLFLASPFCPSCCQQQLLIYSVKSQFSPLFFSFSLILKLTLRPAKGRKRAKKESGRERKGGGQCRQVALGANARRIKGVDRVWKGTTVGEAESGKSDRERCGRRKGAKARCRRGDKCDLLIGKPRV